MSNYPHYPVKKMRIFNILSLIFYNQDKKQILDSQKEIEEEIENFEKYIENKGGVNPVLINPITSNDKSLYKKMLASAVRFKLIKKDLKSVLDSFSISLYILYLIFFPFLIDLFFYGYFQWSSIGALFLNAVGVITFLVLYIPISEYFEMLAVKVGSWFARSLLFLATICSVWFLFKYFPLFDYSYFFKIVLMIDFSLIVIIVIVMLNLLVMKPMVDIIMYSAKIRLTDELILESIWKLVASTSKLNSMVRKRNSRNELLQNVEYLAQLIQFDWSNHINPKDPKYTRWKQQNFTAIADEIRKMKKSIMFPSEAKINELKTSINTLLNAFVSHDLRQLIPKEMPAYRIKKKSILKYIQVSLVSLLPLITAILLYDQYCPMLPDDYQGMPVIIASGWLLLNLILWFDPNLGDKIKLLSRGGSFMSNFNREDE